MKEKLDADEIVAAEDHIVEIGSGFDVEHDFSGIEFSPDKVKITFHEAKDKSGEKFDIGKAGTYKAVYFVEPASKNPSYHVSRNIIVKGKASALSSGKQAADKEESGNSHSDGSEGSTEDGEADLPGQTAYAGEIPRESMTEAEMEAVIEHGAGRRYQAGCGNDCRGGRHPPVCGEQADGKGIRLRNNGERQEDLLSRKPGELFNLLFYGKREDRILFGVCEGIPGYRELRR